MIKELNTHIDYEKNSSTIYDQILHLQETAIANAKRLEATYTTKGRKLQASKDNPSATVYKLVEILNGLAKI